MLQGRFSFYFFPPFSALWEPRRENLSPYTEMISQAAVNEQKMAMPIPLHGRVCEARSPVCFR